MTDRRDQIFRDACDKVSKNCNFPLQSKVEQRPAVASLLDGTMLAKVAPRCSCCVTRGIQEKFNLPTLCYCGRKGNNASPNHVSWLPLAEHYRWPETWILQLHLKGGRRFNPKQGNETCG